MQRFFDETRQKVFIGIVSLGISRPVAAACAGCCLRTIYNEMGRDPSFRDALLKAELSFEVRHVQRIENASADPKHWRASKWSLERRFPDRYAARKPKTMTHAEVEAILATFAGILVRNVPDDALRDRLLGDLSKATKRSRKPSSSRKRLLTPPENSDAQQHETT